MLLFLIACSSLCPSPLLIEKYDTRFAAPSTPRQTILRPVTTSALLSRLPPQQPYALTYPLRPRPRTPHTKRGGNQGLIKIITHGADKAADCMPPTVVHESKLSARLDGGKTHGMLVVSKAVDMAIAKVSVVCREFSVEGVACRGRGRRRACGVLLLVLMLMTMLLLLLLLLLLQLPLLEATWLACRINQHFPKTRMKRTAPRPTPAVQKATSTDLHPITTVVVGAPVVCSTPVATASRDHGSEATS